MSTIPDAVPSRRAAVAVDGTEVKSVKLVGAQGSAKVLLDTAVAGPDLSGS